MVCKSYCLGAMVCSDTNCKFVQQPMCPLKNKFGCPPKPHRRTCVIHQDKELVWPPCTGGEKATPRQPEIEGGPPCVVISKHNKADGSLHISHFGKHNHVRIPVEDASPPAKESKRSRRWCWKILGLVQQGFSWERDQDQDLLIWIPLMQTKTDSRIRGKPCSKPKVPLALE